MIASGGNTLRERVRLARGRPLDVVLDHASLERVSGDPQQLCGLDDGARTSERLLAQKALGFTKIEVFQKNRHAGRIGEIELVGKP